MHFNSNRGHHHNSGGALFLVKLCIGVGEFHSLGWENTDISATTD